MITFIGILPYNLQLFFHITWDCSFKSRIHGSTEFGPVTITFSHTLGWGGQVSPWTVLGQSLVSPWSVLGHSFGQSSRMPTRGERIKPPGRYLRVLLYTWPPWRLHVAPMTTARGPHDDYTWPPWRLHVAPMTTTRGPHDDYTWPPWRLHVAPMTTTRGPHDDYTWPPWRLHMAPMTTTRGPQDCTDVVCGGNLECLIWAPTY